MACISSRWARLLLMMHALLGAVLLGAGLNLATAADSRLTRGRPETTVEPACPPNIPCPALPETAVAASPI